MNRTSKKIRRFIFNILFDIGAFSACLFILSAVKYISRFEKLIDFNTLYGSYAFLILIFSVIFDKYEWNKKYGFYKIINKYFIVWIVSTAISLLVLFVFDINYYQLPYVFLSMLGIFLFELIIVSIRYSYRYAQFVEDRVERKHFFLMRESEADELVMQLEENSDINEPDKASEIISPELIRHQEVIEMINRNMIMPCKKQLNIEARSRHILLPLKNHSLELLVNISRLNYFRYINKYLEIANIKIKKGGYFVVCLETLSQRNERHRRKIMPGIRHIYSFFDYMIHRFWPRLPLFRKIYFRIWKRNNKRISYAEAMGRMYSCGFEYVEQIELQGLTWILFRKTGRPILSYDVTYSPLIRLRRVGKDGKLIVVYKMRTMHPYSEFLQEFIYKTNQLREGGKFRDDFRVTGLGKFMRKFWIDELPMLFNLLRGDLKLVGVRPLSRHYFSLYPEEFRKKRIKFKPGLIPPFYADLPSSLDEIIASEARYLDACEKAPFKTDFIYFWKSIRNILFCKARSK